MSQANARPRLGVHVSTAGGLALAFERAEALGCECMQVFVKNQVQWEAPPLTDAQVRAWRRAARPGGVSPVIAHAAYLVNLASDDAALWRRSIEAFVGEMERCGRLGIDWLVVHPGSRGQQSDAEGVRRVAEAIDAIHDSRDVARPRIVLETTAGMGSSLGWRFEHLRDILGAVRRPRRMAVCLDTAHVFAAGYDLRDAVGCRRVLDAFDRVVGLRKLACCHLNDSRRPLGSRVDRHTHIGDGTLGRSAFQHLLSDPRLAGVPMVLETPKGTDPRGRDWDVVNLRRLRRIRAAGPRRSDVSDRSDAVRLDRRR